MDLVKKKIQNAEHKTAASSSSIEFQLPGLTALSDHAKMTSRYGAQFKRFQKEGDVRKMQSEKSKTTTSLQKGGWGVLCF